MRFIFAVRNARGRAITDPNVPADFEYGAAQDTRPLPRIGEAMAWGNATYRVVDVCWFMWGPNTIAIALQKEGTAKARNR